MGHIRLGTLPKTQKWNQVVYLIAGDADVERIAAASADAAEHGLEEAAQDEGFAHAFWLLTQIPQAARQSNFSERLWELGVAVSSKPTLLEIVAAFTRAVDGHVRESGKRSDLGEMAQHAASETPHLWPDVSYQPFLDRQRVTFSGRCPNLLPRIGLVLSRVISSHDLPAARSDISLAESYPSTSARTNDLPPSASTAISTPHWTCIAANENSLIIREAPLEAKKFAHVAFKKLRAELRKRRDADA